MKTSRPKRLFGLFQYEISAETKRELSSQELFISHTSESGKWKNLTKEKAFLPLTSFKFSVLSLLHGKNISCCPSKDFMK